MVKNPIAVGIESCVNIRGHQMPYAEFDQSSLSDEQLTHIKTIAIRHDLGNAEIYSTRRGFHVFFWNATVSLGEYLNIVNELDCPKNFIRIIEKRGSATNRCAGKYQGDLDIEYVMTIRTGKKNTTRGRTRKALWLKLQSLHASIPKKLLKAKPKMNVYSLEGISKKLGYRDYAKKSFVLLSDVEELHAKVRSILTEWESYDDIPNGIRSEFNEYCAVNEKARYLGWTVVTRISFAAWLLRGENNGS